MFIFEDLTYYRSVLQLQSRSYPLSAALKTLLKTAAAHTLMQDSLLFHRTLEFFIISNPCAVQLNNYIMIIQFIGRLKSQISLTHKFNYYIIYISTLSKYVDLCKIRKNINHNIQTVT